MNDNNFISDLTSLQFAAAAAVVGQSVTNELVTNRKYIYIHMYVVYSINEKGKKINTTSVTSSAV